MSLATELETLIATLMPDVQPAGHWFGGDRDGFTRHGIVFHLEPAGAELFAWERTAGGPRGRRVLRFRLKLRETLTGRMELARDRLLLRAETLTTALSGTEVLPESGSISQILPGPARFVSVPGGRIPAVLELEITLAVIPA